MQKMLFNQNPQLYMVQIYQEIFLKLEMER